MSLNPSDDAASRERRWMGGDSDKAHQLMMHDA